MMEDDSGKDGEPQMHTDAHRLGLISWAMAIVVCVCMAAPATADDLITADEVMWHIETLGLGGESAAQVEALAERANAEASDLDAVRSEWHAWHRSLSGGMRRMVSLIPNGIGVYYFEYQNAVIADDVITSQLIDEYFGGLADLAGDPRGAEALRNAHIVAHFGDANNIRQEKLRDNVTAVLAEVEEDARPQIDAALAQHEKNLASIYREWRQAELTELFVRADAWADRDFEAYVDASLAPYIARTRARDEFRRAGNQILALLHGEARAKFHRDLRRMLYPPTLWKMMDDFTKATGRADLPDAARRALLDRGERFFDDHDRTIEERMAFHDHFYDPAVQRASIVASARNAFYGEPIPAELTISSHEQQARLSQWLEMEHAFTNDVQGILRDHGVGPADPNERMPWMSAPLAADIPSQDHPTWRLYSTTPVIGRVELEQVLDVMSASDDVRTLARAIYDDYRAEERKKAAGLGGLVEELNRKREEVERENPDSGNRDGWNAYLADYAEVDGVWSQYLAGLHQELWADIGALTATGGEAHRYEAALFDLRWERTARTLRGGNHWREGTFRHLWSVVGDAFMEDGMPQEVDRTLEPYRAELTAAMDAVERDYQAFGYEIQSARRRFADDEERQLREVVAIMDQINVLTNAPLEINARYGDLLLAAVNDVDREILQRAFDKEVHPELFVTSPIDLLARELEKCGSIAVGLVDPDRFATATMILDNARVQYDRNTQALMAAKKEWSGPDAEEKWERWREDHPPPDPAMPGVGAEGPMDHLWDTRLEIAKNACAQVGRQFQAQEESELPASVQLLIRWAREE